MKPNAMFIKVLRILLALILLLFSSNGFIGYLSMPQPPAPAANFLQALSDSGFVFPLLYGVEFIMGVLILFNRFVPLVVLMFAPIAVNILLYHLFLDPAGGTAGFLTVLIEVILLVAYFGYYRSLMKPRA